MRSRLPKVLHPLAGKPLVMHALENAAGISDETPVVVVGHGEDAVRQAVGSAARFVSSQSSWAPVMPFCAAESLLAGQTDLVLVTYADMPLLRAETLRQVVEAQQSNPGPVSMLTVVLPDPHGFGRVVRAVDGAVKAIIEEAGLTPNN